MTTAPPQLDSLPEKIDMTTVHDLAIGQMCPIFSGKKGRIEDANLAFSLMATDGENSLVDFVADNSVQYSEWTDGYLNFLFFPSIFISPSQGNQT